MSLIERVQSFFENSASSLWDSGGKTPWDCDICGEKLRVRGGMEVECVGCGITRKEFIEECGIEELEVGEVGEFIPDCPNDHFKCSRCWVDDD